MKSVYKYRVPFKEVAEVVMPEGSIIIRVDGLDGAIWVWAIVDTDKFLVKRTFYLFKTGGEMPNDIERYNYLGCGAIHIQMELMMYLFELPNSDVVLESLPQPFDWKLVQEK